MKYILVPGENTVYKTYQYERAPITSSSSVFLGDNNTSAPLIRDPSRILLIRLSFNNPPGHSITESWKGCLFLTEIKASHKVDGTPYAQQTRTTTNLIGHLFASPGSDELGTEDLRYPHSGWNALGCTCSNGLKLASH